MKERKTALVLAGGGARGAYEAGVWQALTELGVEFDMVCGTSVGAINAAMVVQGDVDKLNTLWKEIRTDEVFDVAEDANMLSFATEFIKNGGASTDKLKALIDKYLDEEAIRNSPIEMGLMTTEFPALKPRPLWVRDIPEGQLGDYIAASSAAFPAIHYYEIGEEKFIDGGYSNNLPIPMAWDNGATDCIAVFMEAPGKYFSEQAEGQDNVTLIKCLWDLGDFLVFDPDNSKRTERLGYQTAMKEYGAYDGTMYTFYKSAFPKSEWTDLDAVALSFDMDPLILYSREKFMERLTDAVLAAKADMVIDADLSLSNLSAVQALASLDKLRELVKSVNKKTLTLFIADSLMTRGEGSIFYKGYGKKLLKDQVRAARWLIKHGLA